MKNKAFDNLEILWIKLSTISKDAPKVDYKNINLLKRYTTEKGKYYLAESHRFQKKAKGTLAGCKERSFALYLTFLIDG